MKATIKIFEDLHENLIDTQEYELLETLQSKKQVHSMSDTHKGNDLASICYAILEELSKISNKRTLKYL